MCGKYFVSNNFSFTKKKKIKKFYATTSDAFDLATFNPVNL